MSKVLDRSIKTPIVISLHSKIRKFGQQVAIMHDLLNGRFGNRIVLDKVSLSYLSACIIEFTLIVQEFSKKIGVTFAVLI